MRRRLVEEKPAAASAEVVALRPPAAAEPVVDQAPAEVDVDLDQVLGESGVEARRREVLSRVKCDKCGTWRPKDQARCSSVSCAKSKPATWSVSSRGGGLL